MKKRCMFCHVWSCTSFKHREQFFRKEKCHGTYLCFLRQMWLYTRGKMWWNQKEYGIVFLFTCSVSLSLLGEDIFCVGDVGVHLVSLYSLDHLWKKGKIKNSIEKALFYKDKMLLIWISLPKKRATQIFFWTEVKNRRWQGTTSHIISLLKSHCFIAAFKYFFQILFM